MERFMVVDSKVLVKKSKDGIKNSKRKYIKTITVRRHQRDIFKHPAAFIRTAKRFWSFETFINSLKNKATSLDYDNAKALCSHMGNVLGFSVSFKKTRVKDFREIY